jgi:hypothetical protein
MNTPYNGVQLTPYKTPLRSFCSHFPHIIRRHAPNRTSLLHLRPTIPGISTDEDEALALAHAVLGIASRLVLVHGLDVL